MNNLSYLFSFKHDALTLRILFHCFLLVFHLIHVAAILQDEFQTSNCLIDSNNVQYTNETACIIPVFFEEGLLINSLY